jgi:hypothetical protein
MPLITPTTAHNTSMTLQWILAKVRIVFRLLLCSLLFGVEGHSSPPPQRAPGGDPVLGERIAKGIAFDGRLWILGTMPTPHDASGGLVSFGISDYKRTVHFEGGVLDLAKSDHELWILRKGTQNHRFVVSMWRGNRFENLSEFQLSTQDAPLALLRSADSPAVLSGEAVYFPAKDKTWSVVQLKGKLRSGVQVSVASPQEGDSIYVGFNVGEWGGGLQQVNLKTGAVTDVERRDTKNLCGGPLTGCGKTLFEA